MVLVMAVGVIVNVLLNAFEVVASPGNLRDRIRWVVILLAHIAFSSAAMPRRSRYVSPVAGAATWRWRS